MKYSSDKGGFPSHEVARARRLRGEPVSQYDLDPEGILPLVDGSTGLAGPAADRSILAAGGAQEPRSAPTLPTTTPVRHPALRIDLRAGVVDLCSVPLAVMYGDPGEYRRVLDMTTDSGWSWSTTLLSGFVVVTRLAVTGGPT